MVVDKARKRHRKVAKCSRTDQMRWWVWFQGASAFRRKISAAHREDRNVKSTACVRRKNNAPAYSLTAVAAAVATAASRGLTEPVLTGAADLQINAKRRPTAISIRLSKTIGR